MEENKTADNEVKEVEIVDEIKESNDKEIIDVTDEVCYSLILYQEEELRRKQRLERFGKVEYEPDSYQNKIEKKKKFEKSEFKRQQEAQNKLQNFVKSKKYDQNMWYVTDPSLIKPIKSKDGKHYYSYNFQTLN